MRGRRNHRRPDPLWSSHGPRVILSARPAPRRKHDAQWLAGAAAIAFTIALVRASQSRWRRRRRADRWPRNVRCGCAIEEGCAVADCVRVERPCWIASEELVKGLVRPVCRGDGGEGSQDDTVARAPFPQMSPIGNRPPRPVSRRRDLLALPFEGTRWSRIPIELRSEGQAAEGGLRDESSRHVKHRYAAAAERGRWRCQTNVKRTASDGTYPPHRRGSRQCRIAREQGFVALARTGRTAQIGLITRRSRVRIPPPLSQRNGSVSRPGDVLRRTA